MANKSKSVSPSAKKRTSKTPVPPPNFDAEIDITAESGSFVWNQTQLFLQQLPMPYNTTPSGLHGEAKIFVDLSVAPAQQRLALYFDAATENGLDIDVLLSITPIDDHFQRTGPAKTYEWKWTTSDDIPAFIDGPVYLQEMKPPGSGGAAGKGN